MMGNIFTRDSFRIVFTFFRHRSTQLSKVLIGKGLYLWNRIQYNISVSGRILLGNTCFHLFLPLCRPCDPLSVINNLFLSLPLCILFVVSHETKMKQQTSPLTFSLCILFLYFPLPYVSTCLLVFSSLAMLSLQSPSQLLPNVVQWQRDIKLDSAALSMYSLHLSAPVSGIQKRMFVSLGCNSSCSVVLFNYVNTMFYFVQSSECLND